VPEYVSCQYYSPGCGWAFVPPTPPDPLNCITVQGQNFSFDVPMVWPWKLATVTYRPAMVWAIGELFLGADSGILTTDFSIVNFDNDEQVLAYVQVEGTGTDQTSWGAVKSLFR
jgi:hypothetical protein